jgi:hypothetical protein
MPGFQNMQILHLNIEFLSEKFEKIDYLNEFFELIIKLQDEKWQPGFQKH